MTWSFFLAHSKITASFWDEKERIILRSNVNEKVFSLFIIHLTVLLVLQNIKPKKERKQSPIHHKRQKMGIRKFSFWSIFWRNLDLKFAYVSYLPTPQVAEHGVQALYLHLNTSVWVTVWFLGIVYSNSMPGFLVWNRSLKEWRQVLF